MDTALAQPVRAILGICGGAKEDKSGWSAFLRHLVDRGLKGVQAQGDPGPGKPGCCRGKGEGDCRRVRQDEHAADLVERGHPMRSRTSIGRSSSGS